MRNERIEHHLVNSRPHAPARAQVGRKVRKSRDHLPARGLRSGLTLLAMNRRITWVVLLLVLAATACSQRMPPQILEALRDSTLGDNTITVGSSDAPETRVAAEIYAQALESRSFSVERRLGVVPADETVVALERGEVEVVAADPIPDVTGGSLQVLKPSPSGVTPVLRSEVGKKLGVTPLLNDVSEQLTTDSLSAMTAEVERGKTTPADAASIWLTDHGFTGEECEVVG